MQPVPLHTAPLFPASGAQELELGLNQFNTRGHHTVEPAHVEASSRQHHLPHQQH